MFQNARITIPAALLAASLAAPLAAQTDVDQLRAEMEALKKGQEAIQKDLDEIKKLLAARPAPQARRNTNQVPPDTVIDLAGKPVKGASDARLAVIEFLDYEWPYCARYVRDTYPQIASDYIDTGKVRYAVMDFPLRNHPNAYKASEAAVCAADQGKFWEMHDLLFQNQKALQADKLPGYAAQLGLDRSAFDKCLEAGKKANVDSDLAAARKAGVSATPTFLIGWIDGSGKVKVEQQLRGAQPYASFQRMLDQLLAKGPDGTKKAAAAE